MKSITEVIKLNKSNIDKVKILYNFIDLGLPSGTLWCDINVNAKDENDPSDYYAWGMADTFGNKDYYWLNYPRRKMKKYLSGNVTQLAKADDVASRIIGGGAHIPTDEQLSELIDNTIVETNDKGAKFISKNNNESIFIPFGGYKNKNMLRHQNEIFLWSNLVSIPNSGDVYHAYALHFDDNEKGLISPFKLCDGMNIRAVKDN